ncbi:uncharacterized protein LOC103176661 [Callorhinchus milii]|uniref:uncharacterized protein LOC103176661 n=1 Tax=Callorhinchus milii TaxID=7868 RepID=UPI001C3F6D70|nr:uncharacterized protein LOC103176661 [Callorhinchus milii]
MKRAQKLLGADGTNSCWGISTGVRQSSSTSSKGHCVSFNMSALLPRDQKIVGSRRMSDFEYRESAAFSEVSSVREIFLLVTIWLPLHHSTPQKLFIGISTDSKHFPHCCSITSTNATI